MPRVLVVDDDPSLRRLIERMLAQHGHDVTVAGDGSEALRLMNAASFELVITDLVMPGMEGLQLLRELKAMPAPPRSIAMSSGGRATGQYLELAEQLGATATIAKPFTQDALIAVVNQVIPHRDSSAETS